LTYSTFQINNKRKFDRGKQMDTTSLLGKYFPDPYSLRIILEHSRLVADKALRIGSNLSPAAIDMKFLEEAAMLHDIGVCRTQSPKFRCLGSEPYIRHGIMGREILENEGFPRHAMVCERHIGVGLTVEDIFSQQLPLPAREMVPLSLEEKIICFADLFYSKGSEEKDYEKSVAEITIGLEKFGESKTRIFKRWLNEFGNQK